MLCQRFPSCPSKGWHSLKDFALNLRELLSPPGGDSAQLLEIGLCQQDNRGLLETLQSPSKLVCLASDEQIYPIMLIPELVVEGLLELLELGIDLARNGDALASLSRRVRPYQGLEFIVVAVVCMAGESIESERMVISGETYRLATVVRSVLGMPAPTSWFSRD